MRDEIRATPAAAAEKAARDKRIRELNDAFRASFIGGSVVMTGGINSLPRSDKAEAIRAVKSFTAFNGDNDPYQEHDFGEFSVGGQKLFWKIDYYDPGFQAGSEDPGDPAKTARVLTIMLAEEY